MATAAKVSKKDSRAWGSLKPPLAEWMVEAVTSMGFSHMTPVQAATLPHFMGNKDVVVEAVTGSGKTLSFLIPVIDRLLRLDEPTKRHHVAAVIVSPTRELAAQIHSVLVSILQFHTPSANILDQLDDDEKRPDTTEPVVVPQLLVGGSNTLAEDLSFFMRNSPNIVIGSPGRLVALLSSPQVHCPQSSFEVLVLDEADRLLDLGFKQRLQGILSRLPKQRRTGLFSASISEAVSEIITVGLRNPVKIDVKVRMKDGEVLQDRKTPASLQMTYIVTPASHKLPALVQLLERLPVRPLRTMVFLSTCAAVDYFQHLVRALLPSWISVIPLHGHHKPKIRQKNFKRFVKAVSPALLLTTDLASRGLDIPQVDLVVQIDAPADPKVFIHRNGRAGRAGRKGLAVIMLHPKREEDYVRFLDVRKTPITPLTKPSLSVSEDDARKATETIRTLVRKDRIYHDQAQQAFVSWVRSYMAHQATSIFRLGDLNWSDLANAWGLLRMPRMPELKNWKGDPTLGIKLNWDRYSYKDGKRESHRQECLDVIERPLQRDSDDSSSDSSARKRKRQHRRNEAWSNKVESEEVRAERRVKRARKRDAVRAAGMTNEERDKQAELDRLIAQVRSRNKAPDDEFAGFDD